MTEVKRAKGPFTIVHGFTETREKEGKGGKRRSQLYSEESDILYFAFY